MYILSQKPTYFLIAYYSLLAIYAVDYNGDKRKAE